MKLKLKDWHKNLKTEHTRMLMSLDRYIPKGYELKSFTIECVGKEKTSHTLVATCKPYQTETITSYQTTLVIMKEEE